MENRDIKDLLGMTCRSLELRADTINEEEKSVEAIITSENAVLIMDWERWEPIYEILLSDGRVENGSQVVMLDSHMRWGIDSVLGSIRKIRTEKPNTIGKLYFASDNEKSDKAWNLVRQKHLTDISAGYKVIKKFDIMPNQKASVAGREFENTFDRILRISYKWQLKEGSLVPIGADEASKIKREFVEIKNENARSLKKMEPDEKKTEITPNPPAPPVDTEKIRVEVREKELKRFEEIMAMGQRFNMLQEAQQSVKEGITVDQFRQKVLDKIDKTPHIDTQQASLDMTKKDLKNYSVLRGIQAILLNRPDMAALEMEASREIAKILKEDPKGFFIPHDVLLRDISKLGKREITTSSGGTGLVATEHLPASFIELLRNQAILTQLGVRILSGLVGNVSIPKQSGASTAYWVAESGNTTPSDSAFTALALSPKTIVGATLYSRNMLLQSNPSIEALVMMDLAQQLGLGIDLAGIAGTGASNQPTGITLTSGIGAVSGAALGWAGVVEFETDVRAANGNIGSMAYLTNATINGLLKTRERASNTARFLQEAGQMNGYPVAVSNQVPSATMIFGVFSQLILALWGGLDIWPDPYTSAADGGVYIRAFQSCDIGVRQAAAFSASTDID